MTINYIKGIFLLLGIAALQACQPEGYAIKGNLTGDVEGKTVYLCKGNNIFDLKGIDSTVIRNGQFEFKGKMEAPELLTIKIFPDSTRSTMGEQGVTMRPIIPVIVDNSIIEITACIDSIPLDFFTYGGTYDYNKVSIKGSPLQEKYMIYKQLLTDKKTIKNNLTGDFYSRSRTDEGCDISDCVAFVRQNDSLQNDIANNMVGIIKENKENLVGLYAMKECMKMFDAPTLKELINAFPATLKESAAGKETFAKADTVMNCAIGSPFIDLDLFDNEGNAVKLSDYAGKGHYTLVEFWASWCGPCRGEIPHLKHVYDIYHPEGFDIISISMDSKKEDWLKAIETEGMNWTQVSDLKAFEGPLAKLYNFDGIPYCVLVGPDGKILHHNARGPELDNLLISLYGNKFNENYRLYK